MSEIQKWKENSLKIQGIWLNDTIDVIDEKLLGIEDALTKEFHISLLEEYEEVLDILIEYLGTPFITKKIRNKVLFILNTIHTFQKRIGAHIPKEYAEHIHASLNEYQDAILNYTRHTEDQLDSLVLTQNNFSEDSLMQEITDSLKRIEFEKKKNARLLAQHSTEKAIHDPERFLKEFKIGDIFWTFISIDDGPIDIEGPLIIESFGHNETGQFVRISHYSEFLKKTAKERRYVEDLTNFYHGVCRTKEESMEYLHERTKNLSEEQKRMLRARAKKNLEFIELSSALLDGLLSKKI